MSGVLAGVLCVFAVMSALATEARSQMHRRVAWEIGAAGASVLLAAGPGDVAMLAATLALIAFATFAVRMPRRLASTNTTLLTMAFGVWMLPRAASLAPLALLTGGVLGMIVARFGANGLRCLSATYGDAVSAPWHFACAGALRRWPMPLARGPARSV